MSGNDTPKKIKRAHSVGGHTEQRLTTELRGELNLHSTAIPKDVNSDIDSQAKSSARVKPIPAKKQQIMIARVKDVVDTFTKIGITTPQYEDIIVKGLQWRKGEYVKSKSMSVDSYNRLKANFKNLFDNDRTTINFDPEVTAEPEYKTAMAVFEHAMTISPKLNQSVANPVVMQNVASKSGNTTIASSSIGGEAANPAASLPNVKNNSGKSENQQLQVLLDAQYAKVIYLETTLTNTEAQYNQLVSERDSLRNKNLLHDQNIDSLNNELSSLKAEVNDLDKKLSYGESQYNQLLSERDSLQNVYNQKIVGSNNEMATINTQIAKVNDLETKLSDGETQYNQLASERDALLSAKSQLEFNIGVMNNDFKKLNDQAVTDQTTISDLHAQMAVGMGELNKLRDAAGSDKTNISNLNRERQELEDAVQSAKANEITTPDLRGIQAGQTKVDESTRVLEMKIKEMSNGMAEMEQYYKDNLSQSNELHTVEMSKLNNNHKVEMSMVNDNYELELNKVKTELHDQQSEYASKLSEFDLEQTDNLKTVGELTANIKKHSENVESLKLENETLTKANIKIEPDGPGIDPAPGGGFDDDSKDVSFNNNTNKNSAAGIITLNKTKNVMPKYMNARDKYIAYKNHMKKLNVV